MAWNVEASQLDDQRHLAHALAILLTVGGTPSIYAGDEQGFRGVKEQRAGGDDAVRPAFPDTPGQLAPDGWGVYRLHQQLIGVRRRHRGLHHARAEPLHLTNTQLVYQVGTDRQPLLVALNLQDPRWTCLPLVPPPSRPARPTCTRSTAKTCVGGSTRTAGPSSPQGVRGAPAPRDPPDDPVLFLEVTAADPSEFEARLQVTGEERHGYRDASPGLRRFRSGSVIAPMPGDRPQADH